PDSAAAAAIPDRPDRPGRPGPPDPPTAPTALEAYRDLIPLDIDEHSYRHTRKISPQQVREGIWPQAIDSVDVLFVHAHPDDESLDFALLMAALARSGLRIATLLLTDGESGLDRYPRRSDYPGYESRLLSGEALREVRIQEAQRALSVLGSDYYIRLALPNHRYNSLTDVLPLPQLLNAWGGETALVQTLLDILARLRPRLVVAPDLPSQARDHFEHEATGYLVRQAVEQAVRKGIGPQGYLVSVDPFQKQFYPSAVAVPRSPRGQDLRQVQRAALSQHHTQADASVIGIRRLADLPSEYYQPQFWNLPESLGNLIGAREAILARE
ncbi:MAG: PIG-L family deacetylase, partial [Spirochaetaceae bacterium]